MSLRTSVLVVLMILALSGANVSSQLAHADLTSIPKDCFHPAQFWNFNGTYNLSYTVHNDTVSGAFTISPPIQGMGVDTGTYVQFLLDPSRTNVSSVSSPPPHGGYGGLFNYSFTGLQAGNHTIIACVISYMAPSYQDAVLASAQNFTIESPAHFVSHAFNMSVPLRATDLASGQSLDRGEIGVPVGLSLTIGNTLNVDKSIVVIVEARSLDDGITRFLDVKAITVGAGKSVDVQVSWAPDVIGQYELRAFALDGPRTPELLTLVESSSFPVFA